MADSDPVMLTEAGAKKIKDHLAKTGMDSTDTVGKRFTTHSAYTRQFWAKLTAVESIEVNDRAMPIFKYAWKEQRRTQDGKSWEDMPDGRSGTLEDVNGSGSGSSGAKFSTWAINDAESDGAYPGMPLEVGVVVRMQQDFIDASGKPYFSFWHWPRATLGRVVCKGPCGENDFKDNRYWVQLVYLANSDGNSTTPLVYAELPPVKMPCPEDVSGGVQLRPWIVTVTNLAEDNCKTHFVLPGTILKLDARLDSGSPPALRYFTSYIDENRCGKKPCEEPSSSSSSSSSSSGSGPCCDCIEIVVADQTYHLHKQSLGTYTGDGFTLTWDAHWIISGPGLTRADAEGPQDCPPMDAGAYIPMGEGSLTSIRCCTPETSGSSSSSSSSSSGSLPPGSGSSGSTSTSHSGSQTTCGIRSIQLSSEGCKVILDITYCDGTTEQQQTTLDCCCGSNSCSCGSHSSGSHPSSGSHGSGSNPTDPSNSGGSGGSDGSGNPSGDGGSSSSSDSGSGEYCYHLFSVRYTCPISGSSGGFGAVTLTASDCGNTFNLPVGIWTNTGDDGSACVYQQVVQGVRCNSVANCNDFPPQAPAPPDDVTDCECGSVGEIPS